MERLLNKERDHIGSALDSQQEDVVNLNNDLNALTNDYNHINLSKSNLEYEINLYKRLVESQMKEKTPANILTIQDDKPLKPIEPENEIQSEAEK